MIDRIVVSSDDSEFIQYWKIVVYAWKKFFPEVLINLAFVTNRSEKDELVKEIRKYGDGVYLFPEVKNIPTANLAKMSRCVLCTQFENDVCMIEDIDTIPMQRYYTEFVVNKREKGKLLVHGQYGPPDVGKSPMSNLTAESNIWKEVINPENLEIDDLFKSWIDLKIFDHKEDITGTYFSDESLMRVLLSRWNSNKIKIIKHHEIPKVALDRSCWNIDNNLLNNGVYQYANMLRPFNNYYDSMIPVVEYIFGSEMLKDDVIIKNSKKTNYLNNHA